MAKSNKQKLRLSQIRERGLCLDDINISFKRTFYKSRHTKNQTRLKEYDNLTEATKKNLSDFVKPFLLTIGITDASIKLKESSKKENYFSSFDIEICKGNNVLFNLSYDYKAYITRNISFYYTSNYFYKNLEEFVSTSIKKQSFCFNISKIIKKRKYNKNLSEYIKKENLIKIIFSYIKKYDKQYLNKFEHHIIKDSALFSYIELNINGVISEVPYHFNETHNALPFIKVLMAVKILPKINVDELNYLDDEEFCEVFFEMLNILAY